MINCILLGSHAHRTPMGYKVYQPLFRNVLNFVNNIEDADVVVLARISDFYEIAVEYITVNILNPNLKLVVISEEPLWDTLWSDDFRLRYNQLEHDGQIVEYTFLNHFTSNIFDFEKIPYFITTEDYFFARYNVLFKRNSLVEPEQYLISWKKRKYQFASMAIKRMDNQFDFAFDDCDVYGLCKFRSLISEFNLNSSQSLVTGLGWDTAEVRQDLEDWHLDKLVSLDQKVFLMSALENTHQDRYISEKLFDAYAIQAVPIYFAGSSHKANKLIEPDSYINLYGLDAFESNACLQAFKPNLEFAKQYVENQVRLFSIFNDYSNLFYERVRLVRSVLDELNGICSTKVN